MGDGAEDDGEDDEALVKEEEVTAIHGWTPSITLELAENLETGEEDEEGKERGLGEARLLRDKATGRVRFLLRQEKTGKVVANHYVLDHAPYCELRANVQG